MVWMGDMHPEIMTIRSVFGNQDIVPKSLDFVRSTNPLPKWINGISSYSMWWIIAQHDWYQYAGDLNYLNEQKDYLTGLLNQLFRQVDNNGLENIKEKMRYIDWPTSENPKAIHAGLKALMVMALDRGGRLCEIIGDKPLADQCAQLEEKMKRNAPDPNNNKQAASLMALAGIISAEKSG